MPSLPTLLGRSSEPKPDPTVIYTCLMSYYHVKWGSYTQGQEARGSHPAVAATPSHWAATGGLTREEISVIAAQQLPIQDLGRETPNARRRLPQPVAASEIVVCTKTLRIGQPDGGGSVVIFAGQQFNADARRTKSLMKDYPGNFAPLAEVGV
jgi:hypothetical protein